MLSLSPKELKAIAKIRGIKGYKGMSEDELLSAFNSSKPVKKVKKSKTDFSKARIEKIRKEFNESRHKFSKSKINEISRNLYEIENEESLFESKVKEIEKNLNDFDDIKYIGIRNVRDLFDLSIDEDYYKPIIAKGVFNSSYIQYESKGGKGKNLSIKKYLNMIKPYLSDITNDHKTQGKLRIHPGNETQSIWKIQLTMTINFISSKHFDETRTMHTKGYNAEIMMGSETDEIIDDLFESFLQNYQERLEESMRGSEFVYDSVDALYYNFTKVSLSRGGSYIDSPKWLKNKKATINPQKKKR